MAEQRAQVSAHTPKQADNLVDVNLIDQDAPICPFCNRGRVIITGKHDWRRPISAWCNNPDCGDEDDDDKGRQVWGRIFPDGTFDRFEAEAAVAPHLVARVKGRKS